MEFSGRELGLGSTISALVLLSISFVLLRPTPKEATIVVTDNDSHSICKLRASSRGCSWQQLGHLAWLPLESMEFQRTGVRSHRHDHSRSCVTSQFLFLWPLSKRVNESIEPKIIKIQPEIVSESSAPTTAEEIARELAEAQETAKPVALTTFAPDYLHQVKPFQIAVAEQVHP